MAIVTIAPGGSIQSAVNANPAGTTFLLSGTYHKQGVTPKNNQIFDGQNKTILDGIATDGTSYKKCFNGAGSNVVIKNMTIQHYQSADGYSAMQCEQMPNVTMDNLTVQFNRSLGVDFGAGAKILRCKLINNGQAGHGGGGRNFLMQDCVIDGNNTRHHDIEDEGGGGKFTEDCTGSIVSHCQYSNNYGVGLWCDESANFFTVEYIEAWNNGRAGIMLEISKNIVVRYCTLWGNMTLPKDPFWDCEMLLASVTDCDIHHNRIDGRAIIVVDQARDPYDPTTRNQVHDNDVTLRNTAAKSGAWTDEDANIAIVASSNPFSANHYHLTDLARKAFEFKDIQRTFEGTLMAGYEVGSTVDTTIPAVPVPGGVTPPPPVLGIGSVVTTTGATAVYATVPVWETQAAGSAGIVTAGPTLVGGVNWWQVDFGSGVDGWVVEAALKLS